VLLSAPPIFKSTRLYGVKFMKNFFTALKNNYIYYEADKKAFNKLFALSAVFIVAFIYLQNVFEDVKHLHIYMNVTNLIFVLLLFFIAEAVLHHNAMLFEAIKSMMPRKLMMLTAGYIVCIVPVYVIRVILQPHIGFFQRPTVQLLCFAVMLVLITFFENFLTTVAVGKPPARIVTESFHTFRKTFWRLTMLKILCFMVLLLPLILVFVNVILSVFALIALAVMAALASPVYVFNACLMVRGEMDGFEQKTHHPAKEN
jgi:hypothetical protein